ncbi:YIP1 family protein [Candidatus Woesearchaeota archaeon]|nr:YIP1 family protein [Candidatus Woesearchaeota archaeon]
MVMLTKIKAVLTAPRKFFQRIQKEKGFKKAFIYFAILSLFSAVVGFLFSLLMLPLYQQILSSLSLNIPTLQYNSGWMILNQLLGYLIGLLACFIVAGLLHAWILIFGGKADYVKTYQLYVYSRTPQFLFGWIPVLGFIAYIYGLVILIIGTMSLHKIRKTKAILMYVIPIGLFFLFMLVFWGFAIYFMSTNPEILQTILAQYQ